MPPKSGGTGGHDEQEGTGSGAHFTAESGGAGEGVRGPAAQGAGAEAPTAREGAQGGQAGRGSGEGSGAQSEQGTGTEERRRASGGTGGFRTEEAKGEGAQWGAVNGGGEVLAARRGSAQTSSWLTGMGRTAKQAEGRVTLGKAGGLLGRGGLSGTAKGSLLSSLLKESDEGERETSLWGSGLSGKGKGPSPGEGRAGASVGKWGGGGADGNGGLFAFGAEAEGAVVVRVKKRKKNLRVGWADQRAGGRTADLRQVRLFLSDDAPSMARDEADAAAVAAAQATAEVSGTRFSAAIKDEHLRESKMMKQVREVSGRGSAVRRAPGLRGMRQAGASPPAL